MKYTILLLVGFLIQLIFINKVVKKDYLMATIFKTIAASIFVYVGFCQRYANHPYANIIPIALLFGAIGDVLLELRHLVKWEEAFFVIGTLSFMSEHIIYISMLLNRIKTVLPICLFISAIIIIALFRYIFTDLKASKVIWFFGTIYLIMLVSMFVISIAHYILNRSTYALVFMIGSIFFAVSDTLLIKKTFGKGQTWMHVVCLIFYYIAQSMIALSLLI